MVQEESDGAGGDYEGEGEKERCRWLHIRALHLAYRDREEAHACSIYRHLHANKAQKRPIDQQTNRTNLCDLDTSATSTRTCQALGASPYCLHVAAPHAVLVWRRGCTGVGQRLPRTARKCTGRRRRRGSGTGTGRCSARSPRRRKPAPPPPPAPRDSRPTPSARLAAGGRCPPPPQCAWWSWPVSRLSGPCSSIRPV